MTIKGAIFDLDGTLLDSMWLWKTIASSYLEERGLEPDLDMDKDFNSMSMLEYAEYAKEHYNLPQTVEEIMLEVEQMVERYYREVFVLKPGIANLLSTFKAAGVPMCIATVTNRWLAEATLERNGILPYFARIFSCRELGLTKSEPQIFELAQELFGLDKADIYVFEDALYSATTAKRAGFGVVGVADKSFPEEGVQLRAIADYFVEDGDFIQVLGL